MRRRSAQKGRPAVSAGNGTLIIGAFPDKFWIIDEATEKVVGTIPFKSGIPRRTTLSRDRKRFYTIEAAMEKVEIIDIADAQDGRHLHAERGQQEGPHPEHRARSAAALRR